MCTVDNPLELPTSPVAKNSENNKQTSIADKIKDCTNILYSRKKPRLVISVQSPTDEECKVDQMEKGYVSKIKSYVTKWTN
jgi:hypothetical protein